MNIIPGSSGMWISTLVRALNRLKMQSRNRLQIYQELLDGTPGKYQVFAGYRFAKGGLVLCGAPIEFTVE